MGPKRKRYDSSGSINAQLDPASKERVEKIFEKKFAYRNPSDRCWSITQDSVNINQHQLWSVDHLIQMKERLNCLKDRLSDKDVIKWHGHTRFTNLAGSVVSELKQVYHVEMCTQAWSKFYEIVSSYEIVPFENETFNTVHLCEAPGAFIAALNHFLITQGYPGRWTWLASTLSPYYEGNSVGQMIDDDRFIRSTLDNWYFGEDGTGDLMNRNNLNGLLCQAAQLGEIHLVTADGSIDCQDNPAEQETIVCHLHYCEAFTALSLLSPGGAFVLKLFTMFESSTVCLMYILNCVFKEVSVFKPATSKSGNSEVYVVCCGYTQSLDASILTSLCEYFFNPSCTPQNCCIFTREEIPKSFLDQHIKCCETFVQHQSDTIEMNILLYTNFIQDQKQKLESMKEYCTELFVGHYDVQTIPGYLKLTHGQNRARTSNFKLINCQLPTDSGTNTAAAPKPLAHTKHKHIGSFQERQHQKMLDWNMRVHFIELCDVDVGTELWLQCENGLSKEEVGQWACTPGSLDSPIRSSSFCAGKLIEQLNDIIQHARILEYRKRSNASQNEHISKELIQNLTRDQSSEPKHSENKVQLFCLDIQEELLVCLEKYAQEVFDIEILTNIEEIQRKADLSRPVVLFCSIISSSVLVGLEEKSSQGQLLSIAEHVCKNLPKHGSLVLQLYTCLTRFSAGIIYILSRCFRQVSVLQVSGGASLQQLLCFKDFTNIPDNLGQYLEDVRLMMTPNSDVIEILPKTVLINDPIFRKFLSSANQRLIASFINDVIQAEKEFYKSASTVCLKDDITVLS